MPAKIPLLNNYRPKPWETFSSEQLLELLETVAGHRFRDSDKAKLWMRSVNPKLDRMRPCELAGRGHAEWERCVAVLQS